MALTYTNNESKLLDETQLAKLIYKLHKDDDEPFAICDLRKVTNRLNLWKAVMPNVECFYAMKANDDPILLKHLKDNGCSFDCSSQKEIETAINLGVSPDKIIFSAPHKVPSHLIKACKLGVTMMVIDCVEELWKVMKHQEKVKYIIRITAPIEATKYKSFQKKYGCSEAEAYDLLNFCKRQNLNVYGICFHVGHCTMTHDPFIVVLNVARRIIKEGRSLGHTMELLDLGGGFPGPAGSEPVFTNISREIVRYIKDKFPTNIRIVGEPGLYLVCNAFTMYTKVIGIRQRPNKKQDVFLNWGNQNGASRIMLDCHSPKFEIIEDTCESNIYPIKPTTVWGPTCDPGDCITETAWPELNLGDFIKITNVGGYTFTRASVGFSGFSNPTKHYIGECEL